MYQGRRYLGNAVRSTSTSVGIECLLQIGSLSAGSGLSRTPALIAKRAAQLLTMPLKIASFSISSARLLSSSGNTGPLPSSRSIAACPRVLNWTIEMIRGVQASFKIAMKL